MSCHGGMCSEEGPYPSNFICSLRSISVTDNLQNFVDLCWTFCLPFSNIYFSSLYTKVIIFYYYFWINFSRVHPVIDHEFRHIIVTAVAVDLWGDSWMDPQTTLTTLCWFSLSISNNRSGGTKTDISLFFFFTITNCEIVCSQISSVIVKR